MAVSRDYSRGNMFSAISSPTVRMKIRGILTKKIACPCVFFCLCFRREREKEIETGKKTEPRRERDQENIKKLFSQLSLEESCPKPKKPSSAYNAYLRSYLSPSIPMLSSTHNAYPILPFLLLSLCVYEY